MPRPGCQAEGHGGLDQEIIARLGSSKAIGKRCRAGVSGSPEASAANAGQAGGQQVEPLDPDVVPGPACARLFPLALRFAASWGHALPRRRSILGVANHRSTPGPAGGTVSRSIRQIAPFLNGMGARVPISRAANSPILGS